MTTSEWEAKQVCPGVWAIDKDTTPFNTIFNDDERNFETIPGFDRAINSVKREPWQEAKDFGYILYKNPQTVGADRWHSHRNPFVICIKSNQEYCGPVIGLEPKPSISEPTTDKDFSSIIQLETDIVYLIDKDVFHRSPITDAERWMYRCFLFSGIRQS